MVNYGSGYIKERIGICKILEIILCILIVVFLHVRIKSSRHFEYYVFNEYDDSMLGLSIAGLVFSLLVLISSCIFGKDIEVLLKWLFILWLILFVAFVVVGILEAINYDATSYLISAIIGIVCGLVYLIDTYFSYKDYNPKC